MRLSKYTIASDIDEGASLLYNMLTKSSAVLPVRGHKKILDYIERLSSNEIRALRTGMLICENEDDEEKDYFFIRREFLFSNKVLRFVVHLNYDCNLRCSYCYQNVIDNKIVMNDLIARNVLMFILKNIADHSDAFIDICFIGGEPMLQSKRMIFSTSSQVKHCYLSDLSFLHLLANAEIWGAMPSLLR